MNNRKEITEVFTPRMSEVNESMYVPRPSYEESLIRAFKRHSHTLIFGESGNGKSWLYKKVLKEMKVPYVIANCANASRLNSLTDEICGAIITPGTATKRGYSEEKTAELGAYVVKGTVTHTGNYDISSNERLLEAFESFNNVFPGKKILVLDNLESIFNHSSLMDELADIIILLDDSRYATCNVNMLIVGTPGNVLQYFRETKNLESVANRITETGKISGLDERQVFSLVFKGFSQLGVPLADNEISIAKHVYYVTLGIAQRVHEYCEILAYIMEENKWQYESRMLKESDQKWLEGSLFHIYQKLESHLNSRKTTVARRNQVIYCISNINGQSFDSSDIDGLVRKEFPSTIPRTNMGIGSILNELSQGEDALLTKNSKTNTFSIKDVRLIMCMRMMSYKSLNSESVMKLKLTL